MEGDLLGEERVIIKHSGDVRDNIVVPRVSLEDSTKIKGSIKMEPKHTKTSSTNQELRSTKKPNAQLTGVHVKIA